MSKASHTLVYRVLYILCQARKPELRMVAPRYDVGAGNCRPFPVLRLRLKRGAFEHHSIQPMRTWITSDAGCSTAWGM